MASNTLGTILIELKAKTDAFERGMKSAKDLSFTTSAEIVGSLERIGKSLLNLKFNNLDQMGRSLGMIGGIAAATGAALATSVVLLQSKRRRRWSSWAMTPKRRAWVSSRLPSSPMPQSVQG
jgi:hypothetical protein